MLTSYLIVGSGRLARHLIRYFELESLPYQQWSRSDGLSRFHELLQSSSHILLAISDSSIEAFFDSVSLADIARPASSVLLSNSAVTAAVSAEQSNKTWVHFSGSLSFSQIVGAHPLMTFSYELYDLDTYRRIPFVLEEGRGNLNEILPGLTNSNHFIEAKNKGLYHALCAMSGNFSIILWEKAFNDFESKLNLPRTVLLPFLERITENLRASVPNKSILTGPLVRGDQAVIDKHLFELHSDPFLDVYRAFTHAYTVQKSTQEIQTCATESPERL